MDKKSLNIRICVTGPIELFIKRHSFTIYSDMVLNYAKSINTFLKNSIINSKYLNTLVVSIDEPSLGYVDIVNVTDDELIKIIDKSLEGFKTTNQIHLHTLNKANIALQTNKIDVLTCEYAADRTNKIPKKELDQYDKFIRVGIARTNINRIIADSLDSGKITLEEIKDLEKSMKLVDSKERIKKRLLEALELYGDRLKFVGPDCGFTGWTQPEASYELLHRIYEVLVKIKKK